MSPRSVSRIAYCPVLRTGTPSSLAWSAPSLLQAAPSVKLSAIARSATRAVDFRIVGNAYLIRIGSYIRAILAKLGHTCTPAADGLHLVRPTRTSSLNVSENRR